ncbi:MAG: NAD(P)-dependent alcohol dehydrogenase [Thermoplasmata archaeon]|nr:MAG: NAD(P)-dependent alcohol dehydrogenase [Thermoplasmata archaeon]
MKAIISTRSGSADHLQLQDVDRPVPKDDEILVKVHVASVTIGDVNLRHLNPLFKLFFILGGFPTMRIPGVEMSGDVEAVGKNVRNFKVGDQVFGTTTGQRYGGNAEYVCVPEVSKHGMVIKKPDGVTFEEVVALSAGAVTALQLLKKAGIEKGDDVLIYGASGSVGTFAVQLAKVLWDAHVTGVCSGRNADLVMSLGADEVVDYTKEDFTERDRRYDVIFDAVNKMPRSKRRKALKPDGKYQTVFTPTKEVPEDLAFLADLVKEGKLRAHIDRAYTLEQVPDAHRYVESGRKRGNIIVNVI